MINEITILAVGVLIGAVAGFGVSWYWVRRYGADLEEEVRGKWDEIKQELEKKIEEIKSSAAK